jgi:purine-binding chemotaxis protein CheW
MKTQQKERLVGSATGIPERLTKGKAVFVQATGMTEEEKTKILRQRAKILAREQTSERAEEACLEVLEFSLAHEQYAMETSCIREVLSMKELTPLPCAPAFVLGIINVRGRILPVIDLKTFFDIPEKGITNLNRVIIAGLDKMELGILSDELIGIKSICNDDIKPPPATITGIGAEYLKGVTEDRLIVLDPDKILSDKRLVVHQEVET